MSDSNKYLPHLDALRFWAFMAVFIAHSMHYSQPELHDINFWQSIKNALQVGVLGVNFFFVLSGFLITRLLLFEKQQYGSIDVLKFYMRRLLRIWPLYFIILLAVFIVYQWTQKETNTHWIYYFSFTGNFHNIIHGAPQSPALANLWTIAVEEQFYFLWPLMLFILSKRSVPILLFFILIVSMIFRSFFVADSVQLYFNTLSICGDFAIGAMGAWLSIYHLSFIQRITKDKVIVVLNYILLLNALAFYFIIFSDNVIVIVERFLFSILFLYIILEQVYSASGFFKVGNNSITSYLGKISYGLYMYHAFGLQISYRLFSKTSYINEPWIYMLAYPMIALSITIMISSSSYSFIEKPLLNLKQRFAK